MPKWKDIDPETGRIYWSKSHGWLAPEAFSSYLASRERAAQKFKRKGSRKYNKDSKKLYYQKNKEKIKASVARWQRANPDKVRAISRRKFSKRLKNDAAFSLRVKMSNRIACALRRASMNSNMTTIQMLGCSGAELKKHLESLFLPGMSWNNWSPKGWHVDHIIPLASAANASELEALCHYTNLQPLWAKDNLKKGSKIMPETAIEDRINVLAEGRQIQQATQQAEAQAEAQAKRIVEAEAATGQL